MPGVSGFDWNRVRNLITKFSYMGVYNAQDRLFDIYGSALLENVFVSHLHAIKSFSRGEYNSDIIADLEKWEEVVNFKMTGNVFEDLKNTSDVSFF